jgi:hypothetical protein
MPCSLLVLLDCDESGFDSHFESGRPLAEFCEEGRIARRFDRKHVDAPDALGDAGCSRRAQAGRKAARHTGIQDQRIAFARGVVEAADRMHERVRDITAKAFSTFDQQRAGSEFGRGDGRRGSR